MVQQQDYYLARQVGSYRLLEKLGSGTYCGVYRGEHIVFKEIVAVKILHAHNRTQQEQDQFFQEARILKTLQHPNVLHVLDAAPYEGTCYIVMDLAAGGSLQDRLKQRPGQPLSQDDAISIIEQVGAALQYIHQHDITHRDLKPANILFDAHGNVLLADFGIAVMLEKTGKVDMVGTPAYMSPEQFLGDLSHKSDQYALGCIAYELLTGQKPFTAPDFNSMGYKHINETITPLTRYNARISPHVEQAVIKAMAKDRNHRFDDVSLFVAALRKPTIPIGIERNPPILRPKVEEDKEKGPQMIPMPQLPQEWSPVLRSKVEEDKRQRQDFSSIRRPKTKEYWLDEGDTLYDLKLYKNALVAYEHALSLDPNSAIAYYAKGNTLYELKQYENALVAYEHAIRLNPYDAYTYYEKGNTLYNLKQYENALVAYEHAIRLDHNLVYAYYGKGLVFQQFGRGREAQKMFDKARKLGYTS